MGDKKEGSPKVEDVKSEEGAEEPMEVVSDDVKGCDEEVKKEAGKEERSEEGESAVDGGEEGVEPEAYAKLSGSGLDKPFYVTRDFYQKVDGRVRLQVLIGRKCESNEKSKAVDLLIGDDSTKTISRMHARIAFNFRSRKFEFVVFGRNGARVDGKFVRPSSRPVSLKSRSTLEIGGRTIVFLLPVTKKKVRAGEEAAGSTTVTGSKAGSGNGSGGESKGEGAAAAAGGGGEVPKPRLRLLEYIRECYRDAKKTKLTLTELVSMSKTRHATALAGVKELGEKYVRAMGKNKAFSRVDGDGEEEVWEYTVSKDINANKTGGGSSNGNGGGSEKEKKSKEKEEEGEVNRQSSTASTSSVAAAEGGGKGEKSVDKVEGTKRASTSNASGKQEKGEKVKKEEVKEEKEEEEEEEGAVGVD
mmetsp:Transcript_2348/g.4875  ORF Transcript_2348/g.4875 Transcript_2348/m.4875 type:complete len:416 (-) Transcript_2348:102-1349(-)